MDADYGGGEWKNLTRGEDGMVNGGGEWTRRIDRNMEDKNAQKWMGET